MSHEGSYRDYRMTLHNVDPPTIPYLGTYLTDLTFIEDGNQDMDGQLINFDKRYKVAAVIGEIQQYQRIGYDSIYTMDEEMQTLLKNLPSVNEEEAYKISLKVEPRNPEEALENLLMEEHKLREELKIVQLRNADLEASNKDLTILLNNALTELTKMKRMTRQMELANKSPHHTGAPDINQKYQIDAPSSVPNPYPKIHNPSNPFPQLNLIEVNPVREPMQIINSGSPRSKVENFCVRDSTVPAPHPPNPLSRSVSHSALSQNINLNQNNAATPNNYNHPPHNQTPSHVSNETANQTINRTNPSPLANSTGNQPRPRGSPATVPRNGPRRKVPERGRTNTNAPSTDPPSSPPSDDEDRSRSSTQATNVEQPHIVKTLPTKPLLSVSRMSSSPSLFSQSQANAPAQANKHASSENLTSSWQKTGPRKL